MTELSRRLSIFIIGSDDRLNYLFKRYAEQGQFEAHFYESAPAVEEIYLLHPTAIIFSSLVQLQTAQVLVETLSSNEIFVLVCASLTDEFQARELGADTCLFHPLTYDQFMKALLTV